MYCKGPAYSEEESDEKECEDTDIVNSIILNMTGTSSKSPMVSEKDHAIKMVIENHGNDELRQFLKQNQTLVESAKDWAGDGLLATAAWHGKADMIQMLLWEFRADVNAKNYKKTTPLHRASASGGLKCAEILLEKGADAEYCDAAGRTPVDVSSGDAMRELLKERIRADREEVRQLHIAIRNADREFEENKALMLEADHARKIASRLNQAVPIMFQGASNGDVNGAYDPIYEMHDEWPTYRKRDSNIGKSEIILLYDACDSSWTIKSVPLNEIQDGDSLFYSQKAANRKGKSLVKLYSDVASFPELRLEGSNGIKEIGTKGDECVMSVIPESEWLGAQQIEKLKRSNNQHHQPLRDYS